MSRGVLIVGAGPAGMQAASDLADAGVCVELLTASPFLAPPETAPGITEEQNARLLALAKHPRVKLRTGTRVIEAEGGPGRYRFRIRRQPRYVDLSKCTACGDCIEICPVTVPGRDRKAIFLPEGAQPGCAAIDKQGTPPCTHACPGGIPVQGYVALIAQGRFREALDLVEAAIPFPGICGRVCTHPCEVNCRRNEVDAPVAIRALKRFLSDWAEQHPQEPAPRRIETAPDDPQVAVVGSGPAGMSAALGLVRRGYRVTVFEKMPVIAGMMAVGIPAYRLPREVIAREYQPVLDLGVEVRLNTSIGPCGDYTLDELFARGFKAVCLAVGAHRSLPLHIPGETLPGVVHGVELLKSINLSQQLEDPVYRQSLEGIIRHGPATKAVVLGGGNTAMDAARSLRRLGLADVRILYRRSRQEMPAMPEEIADAEAEGVRIDFLTAPVAVLGDRTSGASRLRCVRMRLEEPDSGGRRRPVPVEDGEFTLEADLIVPAVGQVPDLDEGCGFAVDRRGRIELHGPGCVTSRPGVFAAGDAVSHDRMAVIEAIGMGKQAAADIDAFLRGGSSRQAAFPAVRLPEVRRPLLEPERTPIDRLQPPKLKPAEAAACFDEVELGFSTAQAREEAARCLACGPCSECMACVAACRPGAVVHEQQPLETIIEAAAAMVAEDCGSADPDAFSGCRGLKRVPPDEPVAASAAAAGIMAELSHQRVESPNAVARHYSASDGRARIGVFVCRCMGQISAVLDTARMGRQAERWGGVALARELDVSCSPQAADAIRADIERHGLDRIVLAACVCCAVDQVCFSCTYQRVRCKQQLGVLPADGRAGPVNAGEPVIPGLPAGSCDFVNIREQCAWAHRGDPEAATAKALALVAAGVARAQLPVEPTASPPSLSAALLVVGSGASAGACLDAAVRQGMEARRVSAPACILRRRGRYVAFGEERQWEGGAVVVAPKDEEERRVLMPLMEKAGGWADCENALTGGTDLGIFFCRPEADGSETGAAAAARAAAWLGRHADGTGPSRPRISPGRCRACTTCVQTCEIGAVSIVSDGQDPAALRHAQVDPVLCNGCGSCAARCPSNAIEIDACSDARLAATISALLI